MSKHTKWKENRERNESMNKINFPHKKKKNCTVSTVGHRNLPKLATMSLPIAILSLLGPLSLSFSTDLPAILSAYQTLWVI